MRRAEEAAPPVAGRGDRAADRRAPRSAAAPRVRARRRDPPGSRRAGHPARGFADRHALETELAPSWRRRPRVDGRHRGTILSLPKIVTELPGPNAKAIIARDAKAVSPSYTRGYPLVMARGEGAIVEDVDGNRFLDCAAGIAVNSTGHSHPEVVAAIVEQAQQVPAHVGDRLLLRAAGAARRGDRPRSCRSTAASRASSATRAPRPTKRRSSWRAITRSGRS